MRATSTTMPTAVQPRRPNLPRRRGGRLSGKAPRDVGVVSGGDVEIDNGPRELLHQAPAQVAERVEAGRVTALEGDLQRVLTNQRHVADAQLFVAERFHTRQASGHSCFAAAFGARTCPAKLLARVARA